MGNRRRNSTNPLLLLLVICTTSACSKLALREPSAAVDQTTTGSSAGGQAGQTEVLQAQQNQARKVEVTLTARVLKMLPEDTRGLPHERFLLRLDNGTSVLVAHDTKMAPRVPLQEGDLVTLHGEYIWNQRGGVIHWTHHSANGRHEGGWIDFNGQRYQ